MKNLLCSAGVLLACLLMLPARAQVITTVVGTGAGGFSGDNGPAKNAFLNFPQDVALDRSGNMYIADLLNNRIRKVNAVTGIITTIAGTDSSGFNGDNILATSARLYSPFGGATDTSGNVYIADEQNQRIRKVTSSTGIITSIAGTGNAGYSGDGGTAINAQLNYPTGVAVDKSGNVYIAEAAGNRIRKINAATNVITTIAGDGTQGYGGDGNIGTNAQLNTPYGVAVDASGNVYVADQANNCVRKIAASTGIITTIAGTGTGGFSGDGGPAASAQIYQPNHLSVDAAGNVYFADGRNQRIREIIISTGIITTVAGSGGNGSFSGDGGLATSAKLFHPTGVSFDGAGNMYIVDNGNFRIRKITYATAVPGITAWPTTLSVFPSPNTGHFTITATGANTGNERVQIALINTLGQSVYSTEATPAGAQWSIPVQVGAGVANGLYQLRISTGNASAVRSVVIAR